MSDEIEIRHCSGCNPVNKDEVKYCTDIIATNCFWMESLDVDYTLQQNPVAGKTYLVKLSAPVRFSLNSNIWLFYDCPMAYYNGYEKEEEIDKAVFCFGE